MNDLGHNHQLGSIIDYRFHITNNTGTKVSVQIQYGSGGVIDKSLAADGRAFKGNVAVEIVSTSR